MAGVGQQGTIRKIGGSGETRRFLEDLGFVPGTPITVLSVLGGQRDREHQRQPGSPQRGDGPANLSVKGENKMTLGEAKVGSTVVVTRIEGDGAYKRRIMDMGITKGTSLYIRKVAPLGDPVEITVRGYELSLRKNDARCVEVR